MELLTGVLLLKPDNTINASLPVRLFFENDMVDVIVDYPNRRKLMELVSAEQRFVVITETKEKE